MIHKHSVGGGGGQGERFMSRDNVEFTHKAQKRARFSGCLSKIFYGQVGVCTSNTILKSLEPAVGGW